MYFLIKEQVKQKRYKR